MATATTWGDPSATKRVLLLHGLTRSSQFWYRIAQDLASRGYFVTAPDLLGHGFARRGSVYTVAAYAEALKPFLTPLEGHDHPYDIVIGHSLGGILIAALLPFFASARQTRAVLVDPPLELTPEMVAFFKEVFTGMVGSPEAPKALVQQYPDWTKEDAAIASLSVHLCDVKTVEATFEQNDPWSFSHYLSTIPDNVKVTVLAADPSKGALIREQDLNGYPLVEAKTVWGISHIIPLEKPEVVVETALEGMEIDEN